MATENYPALFDHALVQEGGYSNNPHNPGNDGTRGRGCVIVALRLARQFDELRLSQHVAAAPNRFDVVPAA